VKGHFGTFKGGTADATGANEHIFCVINGLDCTTQFGADWCRLVQTPPFTPRLHLAWNNLAVLHQSHSALKEALITDRSKLSSYLPPHDLDLFTECRVLTHLNR